MTKFGEEEMSLLNALLEDGLIESDDYFNAEEWVKKD